MGSWPPWNISSHFDCLWQFPTTFPVFFHSAHMPIFKWLGKKTWAVLKFLMPPWCILMLHLKFMNHKDCKTQIICCDTTIILLSASGSLPISSVIKKQNLLSPQLLVPGKSSSRFPVLNFQISRTSTGPSPPSRAWNPLYLNFQLKYSKQPLLSKLRDNLLPASHSVHRCSKRIKE